MDKCFAFTPQANFPSHNLNFTEGEGDGIESFNLSKSFLLYEDPQVISCQVYGPGVVLVADLRVLVYLGGGRIPSMDISPDSKEFCRYGRVRFKKGRRDGCVGEFNSHSNLAVNVSGSLTPSIKL